MPELTLPTNQPASNPPISPSPPTLTPSINPKPSPPVNLSIEPNPTASTESPRRSGKKRWLLVGLLVLIIIAIGVGIYLKYISSNKTADAKKDIPLVNFGISSGDGEVPNYPITYLADDADVYIASQMYEGLTGFSNQTQVVPLLATSWSNPNDTTWIFNLRHNVKFHTGRTMTATDVKFSLNYAMSHENDDNGNSVFLELSDISKVNVLNPYKVEIITSSPDAVLLSQLGAIGIVDSHAKVGSYDAGTGPYIVKPGTTPTSTSIDLEAVNNYWGGHVYTREVDIRFYGNDNKMASDVNSGKLDMAGPLTNGQLAIIKSYHPLHVLDQGLEYIGVNTERTGSPLQSVAARQALAYALNIPAVLKAGGLIGQQVSQIVPRVLPGYNPNITNTPYDPAKAKQLLAGVSNLNESLTFAYTSDNAGVAAEIIKELEAVGFHIQPMLVDNLGDLADNADGGQYDLFLLGDSSSTIDGLDLLTDLLEDVQYYDNTQIDNLVNQTENTLSSATRIADMQQIATIVANDKPIIPLYVETEVWAYTKPYIFTQDQPDVATDIYLWKMHE